MTHVTRISQEALHSVLLAGIQAPSADNNHLFRYGASDDCVSLLPSDEYASANAQTRLLAWISYGAVVENIIVQATQFGLHSEPTWFPDDRVICAVRFSTLVGERDALANAIGNRCTNRRLLFGSRLDSSMLEKLEHQVSHLSGVRLLWLDKPELRKTALRLVRLAEAERFRVPDLHAELFSSLRFDVGPADTCDTGIPLGAAEIEMPARPFFRLIRKWSVMRALNRIGAYRAIGWRAGYLPARLAPHLGVLVADGEIRQAAVRTGRAFERLWLRAAQLGLALQPMAAAPLYARPEAATVTRESREELIRGWKSLIPGNGTPLMLFRLGLARVPAVRAGRQPLATYYKQHVS